MSHSKPSSSSSTTLSLVASLPIPHPTLTVLLTAQAPLAHPSSSSAGTKFLARLNTAVLGRDPACAEIAALVVKQDEEGYALSTFGKGWIGACIGVLGNDAEIAFLEMAASIIETAPRFPSFERETILPITGKLAVILLRVIERETAEGKWDVLTSALLATQRILNHYPSAFRPLQQSLSAQLTTIILHTTIGASSPAPSPAPRPVTTAAADLLATLHTVGGKAVAPSVWATDIRGVIGGIGAAVSAITADAWEEDPFGAPPPPLVTLPLPPADPLERSELGLAWLEGWTEAALALLRRETPRAVPVPIAQLVSASLRCLNLTLDTPTTSYISPQHHALLIASIPRIWTCGVLLLASTAAVCGDHLLPHLGTIFEQTVFLLQQCPAYMPESRAQLFSLHIFLLDLYPPALLHIDHPTSLLKYALATISGIFQPRVTQEPIKKRGRGFEDRLIGGLEGRSGKRLTEAECDVVLQALQLTKVLHATPLLSPSLLSLSIRVHLAAHMALPSAPIAADFFKLAILQDAVEDVLSAAALMTEGQGGTSKGWQTLLLSLMPTRGERFSLLLHPSVPPMHRPQPPLAQLHFFAPEDEEEKRLRLELGIGSGEDDEVRPSKKGRSEGMDVDKNVVAPVLSAVAPVVSALAPAVSAVAVAPTVLPVSPQQPLPLSTLPKPTPPVQLVARVELAEDITNVGLFMDAPKAAGPQDKGKGNEVESTEVDEDDDAIPELDSGSEDEDDEE